MNIRKTELIAMLVEHALGRGKPRASETQIKVALELLKLHAAETRSRRDKKAKARTGLTHEEALRALE